MQVSLGQCWYLPVAAHPRGLLLGGQLLADGDTVVGLAGRALNVATLRVAARAYDAARGMAPSSLAALVAFVTGDPAALHPCFPMTRTLDPAELAAFDALVAAVARSPELDLRCPNAFAAQNPTLYAGFVALFGQDPRRAWAEDFPFYVQANREYYASGACPPPDGLTPPNLLRSPDRLEATHDA